VFGSRVRILVADDSSTVRTMIKKNLEELGYDLVATCADGLEALQALTKAQQAKQPFDLLLSDWNMPKANGLEVLKRLRADKSFDGLAIIMVTSEAERGTVLKAIMSGLDGFILKPFDITSLQRAIESSLKRRSTPGTPTKT
jgi:two-component system chemotaxis response regulator CheY